MLLKLPRPCIPIYTKLMIFTKIILFMLMVLTQTKRFRYFGRQIKQWWHDLSGHQIFLICDFSVYFVSAFIVKIYTLYCNKWGPLHIFRTHTEFLKRLLYSVYHSLSLLCSKLTISSSPSWYRWFCPLLFCLR